MPDYKNGKVYVIRCNETDDVYIGSTTQTLSMRMVGHRVAYKRHLSGKGNYVSSYEVLKYESAYIELLEEFPCENREQLNKREGELIRGTKCVNKCIAGRSHSESSKLYKAANREKINEQQKVYYAAHKEAEVARVMAYQAANREKRNEYMRKRYAAKKLNETQPTQVCVKSELVESQPLPCGAS